MNVIVNLSTPLIDGTEVVFKAPCDAHAVTGLMVHYPNYGSIESQEFLFADAHANDVGDIADLFAKDAVVKVILDLDTHKAFVQNGDTNAYLESRFNALPTVVQVQLDFTTQTAPMTAEQIYKAHRDGKLVVVWERGGCYLPRGIFPEVASFYRIYNSNASSNAAIYEEIIRIEGSSYDVDIRSLAINDALVSRDEAWSSKKIVDNLCPDFVKSGRLVQCEPVEGTEIHICASEVAGTDYVTVCGKNLYDKDVYPLKIAGYSYSGTSNQGIFSASDTYRRTDFIPVAHLRGQTIVLNHPPSDYGTISNPGMSFYTSIPDVSDNAACKDAWCGGTTGGSIKVPDNAEYMVFCVRKQDSPEGSTPKDIQIEVGSTPTNYNEYKLHGSGFLAEPSEVITVKAGSGIHTIYGIDKDYHNDVAKLLVYGKACPVALIDKLTNAVRSLGGDV